MGCFMTGICEVASEDPIDLDQGNDIQHPLLLKPPGGRSGPGIADRFVQHVADGASGIVRRDT